MVTIEIGISVTIMIKLHFLRDNYPTIFQRCQGKRRFMVLKME